MTVAEIKQAKAADLVMERDASFGTVVDVPTQTKQREARYDMRTVTVSLFFSFPSGLCILWIFC